MTAWTTATPAQQLATLHAMTADQPDRHDQRSQEAIDHDMRLEQLAEDRRAARRGEFDGERSQEELAARRSG